MTPEELRAVLEGELAKMRKWEPREYHTERVIIDVLNSDLRNKAALQRARALLNELLLADLRKATPEGNA